MIDKQYFEVHLRKQFEELGTARATVFLHSGQDFQIQKIESAHEGYVLLVVYPEDGVSKKTKQQRRKPGGTDEVFWDRVAVPYESIAHVWLSVTEPDKGGPVGFSEE
jgi:hypothetical protein